MERMEGIGMYHIDVDSSRNEVAISNKAHTYIHHTLTINLFFSMQEPNFSHPLRLSFLGAPLPSIRRRNPHSLRSETREQLPLFRPQNHSPRFPTFSSQRRILVRPPGGESPYKGGMSSGHATDFDYNSRARHDKG